MMRFRDVCPTCFIQSGFSIEMKKDEKGVFHCPNDGGHRFKKDSDGYWKKAE